MNLYTLLGIGFVIYVAVSFFKALGKRLPILELMLLIAGLQWIIGPFIEYNADYHDPKYYMYVNQETYMSFIAPAYGVFTICIVMITRRYSINIQDILDFKKYSNYGVTILFVGISFELLGFILPGALGFLVFLMAGFKYVGAIILYFSDQRIHRYIFYGSIAFLMFMALKKALFHDFILWSTFFYMFYAIKSKPSPRIKLFTMIAGFVMLTIIQAVKSDYRELLKSGSDVNFIELFFGTVNQKYESGYLDEEEETAALNVRLNQGWIISAVMDHVPRNLAFADGETVKEAVVASLVPRFLNPNKKEAGGQDNFEKYTGLSLSEEASMGLSIIGEFYANFGVRSGIVAIGVWGLFLAFIWRRLVSNTYKVPLLIFFLPLIFLQVVKAETELVVVLNHLIKSIIAVSLFFWLTKKYLKWQIFAEFDR
ncbi:MAG: hypothetical protein R2797_03960 [Gelidibacter sp.]